MYSNNLICDILKYIDDNINSKISIEDLEKRFFYNRYYIMKLFKKEIGYTLIQYINSMRIYNSIILIRETSDNLLNIAFKCGFMGIEYFSETFKSIIGVNPQIANNYLKHKKNISLNQIEIINISIASLYVLKRFKDKYISNREPNTMPTKKLSIFK